MYLWGKEVTTVLLAVICNNSSDRYTDKKVWDNLTDSHSWFKWKLSLIKLLICLFVCMLKKIELIQKKKEQSSKRSFWGIKYGLDPGDRGKHMGFAWSFWRGRGKSYLQIISV